MRPSTAFPWRSPGRNVDDVDTWIFLGALALATVGVLAFYGWAISGYHPPEPRDDLIATTRFVEGRERESEINLGRNWRSTDDPGAMWHVWWSPRTGELLGLRMGALPPPPGPVGMVGAGGTRDLRATLYNQLPYSGMKVLGHYDHRPPSELCDHIRQLHNGLDLLCGGTYGDDGGAESDADVDLTN